MARLARRIRGDNAGGLVAASFQRGGISAAAVMKVAISQLEHGVASVAAAAAAAAASMARTTQQLRGVAYDGIMPYAGKGAQREAEGRRSRVMS